MCNICQQSFTTPAKLTAHKMITHGPEIPPKLKEGTQTPTVSITQLQWDIGDKSLWGEASTLGWRPGKWPSKVTVQGKNGKIDFIYSHDDKNGFGEVQGVVYKSKEYTLFIAND